MAPKLGLFPRPLGKGDAGLPPVSRTVFELNGATLHEIFWNVLVCQNWIDYGIPASAQGSRSGCDARRLALAWLGLPQRIGSSSVV